MTFDEWWEDGGTDSNYDKAICRSAWNAATEQANKDHGEVKKDASLGIANDIAVGGGLPT